MKIIKRNGTEVAFDVKKIVNAIRKANNEVSEENRLSEEQILQISEKVTALSGDLNNRRADSHAHRMQQRRGKAGKLQ